MKLYSEILMGYDGRLQTIFKGCVVRQYNAATYKDEILIKDYTLGYKLPGAGGGGYLYMVAKDPQAAVRIRKILTENAPNPRARFVEMTLSDKGFQVSRS